MVAIKKFASHCPTCNAAYALVGRIHNCRPRVEQLRQKIASVDPAAQQAKNAEAHAALEKIGEKPLKLYPHQQAVVTKLLNEPQLDAAGNEAMADAVARGLEKMMSEAICGVDLGKPSGDMTAYASITRCDEDGKLSVQHLSAEDFYQQPGAREALATRKPLRDRAAYMRDYRARKREQKDA